MDLNQVSDADLLASLPRSGADIVGPEPSPGAASGPTAADADRLASMWQTEAERLAAIGQGVAVIYLLAELFAGLPEGQERLQAASSRLLLDLAGPEANELTADVVAPALQSVRCVAELAAARRGHAHRA